METMPLAPCGQQAKSHASQTTLWDEDAGTDEGKIEPVLTDYSRIIVAFSGGADSMACVLHLLDLGVPASRIHLHHHRVDGDGENFMDWPCCEAYCEAVAKALGMEISFSWKHNGFEGEMLRENAPTAPTAIPFEGGHKFVGGDGPLGTRRKFPQVSMDLNVRFCSGYLKISPMDSWIKNDPQFLFGKTLIITGERAEESSGRAKYKTFEPHRSDNRFGVRVKRYVDHWRPVHAWPKTKVWETIQRHRIQPFVSYMLGWPRASCIGCVFGGPDQWASVKIVVPKQYTKIANYEKEFGVTIHRTLSVETLASQGTPYDMDPFWLAVARSKEWTLPIIVDDWKMPIGAFGDQTCGPT